MSLLCLSAPLGPVGLTHKCQDARLHLRRRRANQHDRYQVGAVCQPKSMCETHVGQAPSRKLLFKVPKMVGAFWTKRTELTEWGLHEGLFMTFTHQEQAELLSLAFVDWVVGDVIQRSSVLLANNKTEDGLQQNLKDLLSIAEVAAQQLQVPLE